MIQQYVWGSTANNEPCIVVILAHLDYLSAKDQKYWRLHELTPAKSKTAKIERRYAKSMLHGEFPDRMSGYDAIFLYVREIQNIFHPKQLFTQFEDNHPDFLALITHATKRHLANFAQHLHSFLTISMTTLIDHIVDAQRLSKAKECRSRQQGREILRLYFQEHCVMSARIELGLSALSDLNKLRVESAHSIVPNSRDKDYRKAQSRLVNKLQRGLRAMLVAFIKANRVKKNAYLRYVLKLGVDA